MPYRYAINTWDGESDDPDAAHIESAESFPSVEAAAIACIDRLQSLPAYNFAFVYDARTGIRVTHENTPPDPRVPRPIAEAEADRRMKRFLDRD